MQYAVGKGYTYKDLIVWQKSMSIVKEVCRITPKLPKEELFALSNQIRRSVISIPPDIAEGYGRQSPVDYLRFLKISRGSKNELATQLQICRMPGYVSNDEVHSALAFCEEVGRLLIALIASISEKT